MKTHTTREVAVKVYNHHLSHCVDIEEAFDVCYPELDAAIKEEAMRIVEAWDSAGYET